MSGETTREIERFERATMRLAGATAVFLMASLMGGYSSDHDEQQLSSIRNYLESESTPFTTDSLPDGNLQILPMVQPPISDRNPETN